MKQQMKTIIALCAALVASSQTATVVSSICDSIGKRPVRVVSVTGTFCVPLRPCEGSVSSAADGPFACPRKGQRDVLGNVELTRDSCCAVIDSKSGALGCVLIEGLESTCLLSADWPRGREFTMSRQSTRSRTLLEIAADVIYKVSQLVAEATTEMTGVATATLASVATPMTTASMAAVSTPTTPTPVTSLVAITPTSTINTAFSGCSSESSSSSGSSGSTISAPVIEEIPQANSSPSSLPQAPSAGLPNPPSLPVIPSSNLAAGIDGEPLPPTMTPATISTSRPLSESDSESTYLPAAPTMVSIVPPWESLFDYDGSERAELSREASLTDTSGSDYTVDEFIELPSSSALATDSAASALHGSLLSSRSPSSENGPSEPSLSFLETGSKSTGSTNLSGEPNDVDVGASGISRPTSSSLSEIAVLESNSSSANVELEISDSTASKSGEITSLDDTGISSTVESPSAVSSSLLSRPPSSASHPSSSPSSPSLMLSLSGSSEMERLTPLPTSNGLLQLSPITDDSEKSVNPLPSDSSLSSVHDEDTGGSEILGSNTALFIIVGSVAMVALIFGIFYLRPKRTNPLESLTPREPLPMDRTGAYRYDHFLESESAGLYDTARTPRAISGST